MYERYAKLILHQPWAIRPEVLSTIVDLLRFRVSGGRLTPEEIQARLGAVRERQDPPEPRQGAIGILPIYGIIIPRGDLFSEMSGATSIDRLSAAFARLEADPAVGSIILDIDSPGGTVAGVPEFAEQVRASSKRVVALADTEMASGAYWIGSAADEIVVTSSSLVGSIGVFAAHDDISRAMEMMGVKTTLISAGKYKVEGNPFEPLSDEAREAMQQLVGDYYTMFVQAVAKGRGVTPAAVRGGFGEGRVVTARDALSLGMADRVGTLTDTIQRLSGRSRRDTSASSLADIAAEGLGTDWAAPVRFRAIELPDGEAERIMAMTDHILLAGPIPPHDSTAIADEDEAWDADAELAKAEGSAQLRRMHAWVDSEEDPEAKSSYKLPHHRADGTMVPKGVFAAAQREGQTDIPEGDHAGVRRHLGHHYDEMDRTPPWEEDGDEEGRASAELELRRRRMQHARA